MIKDKNYLKKFKYLSGNKYRTMWEENNYEGYSKTHQKKIKNFWETFKLYGFDKNILSN